jgi:TPR repeat protein
MLTVTENDCRYIINCDNNINYHIIKSDDVHISEGNKLIINNLSNLKLVYREIIKMYSASIDLNISNYNSGTIAFIVKKYDDVENFYLKTHYSFANIGLAELYMNIKKDHVLGVKYCLIAINKGFVNANSILGKYYYRSKNYEEMKKYFLNGMDNGCNICPNELGFYYENVKNNTLKAKNFYLIATDKNNSIAASNLAFMYDRENNDILAIKYYNLSISLGNTRAIYLLANYYYKKLNYNLATTNFLRYYIAQSHITYSIYRKLIVDVTHLELLLDIVRTATMENIINIVSKIDGDFMVISEFFSEIIKKHPDIDKTASFSNKIQELNSYTLCKKFMNYINAHDSLISRIQYIDRLSCVDEECNICNCQDNCAILLCHDSHIACKECIMKLNECPYCRKMLL